MSESLIVVGLLALIATLAVVVILLLSNLGAYFTKIAQGTTAFINVGDSLHAILPNIGGHMISKERDIEGQSWLIPGTDDERTQAFFHESLPGTVWLQKLMWEMLGVRFTGWTWPNAGVHKFDIRSRKRIRERTGVGKGEPLRSRVMDSTEPSTVVESLLFLVPRPVYMEGVELAGDNSKIDLLLLPIYRQVIPSLPVYNLKGDFFTPLDAAIEAAMVDFFASHRVAVYKGKSKNDPKKGQFAHDSYDLPKDNDKKKEYENAYEESPLTYSHWLKLTKAGEESPVVKQLLRLNASKAYRDKLKEKKLADYVDEITHGETAKEMPSEKLKEMIPSGIIHRFGFALVSFRIVEWEPHTDTEPLAKALLAKETELHTAEGVRQKAFGERDADKARAEGYRSRYLLPVQALIGMNVSPNVAAEVLATQLRTENIGGKDSKIVTYVEGGASASVMVNSSQTPTK